MSLKIEKLVVASHNAGKVKEINALLEKFGVNAISAAQLNLLEPEETEDSFVGNALLKARAAANASGLVALADDSGLEVMALSGAPGIYSARWAGEKRDFYEAMAKVESELKAKNANDYSAQFICVLALVYPNGDEKVFEGIVKGQLEFPPRGENGFGYDPIFVPDGYDITFGQMDPDKKHAMSHRANAFKLLVEQVFEPK
jgi:XTP/dITP diphosphohydrolase